MKLFGKMAAGLLVASALAFGAGCSGAAETNLDDSTESDLTGAAKTALIAKIRATYEAAQKSGSKTILTGEKDADSSKLARAARSAFLEYQGTSKDGLINEVGSPVVKVGTIDGQKIYFVAGDVSDTGSEFGFYDAKGNFLTMAYRGQGERPNANGVDWIH